MTQGLLSIIIDDTVVAKLVVGCDGIAISVVVDLVRRRRIRTAKALYDAAEECGMGCDDCRVAMDTEDTVFRGDDLPDDYRRTFGKARWNPRWARGTAPFYTQIVRLSAKPVCSVQETT